MLCQYKDYLRILQDTGAIVVGGLILALIFKFNVLYTILALCVLSILFHRLFCVKTIVDKYLFPEN